MRCIPQSALSEIRHSEADVCDRECRLFDIDDTIVDHSVNGDSDVVLGDNILLGHIQCLHLHRYYAEGLRAGVVVVRSRADDALQLAELAGLATMIQGGNYLKDSSTEAFLHGDHRAATTSEGNA